MAKITIIFSLRLRFGATGERVVSGREELCKLDVRLRDALSPLVDTRWRDSVVVHFSSPCGRRAAPRRTAVGSAAINLHESC